MSDAPPVIEMAVEIKAPVEAVYRALTEPAALAAWFPSAAEVEPRAGGRYRFAWSFTRHPERDHVRAGEVLALLPHRRVSYSWHLDSGRLAAAGHPDAGREHRTVVELSLLPGGPGVTVVALRHDGWGAGEGWDELVRSHTRGWSFYLDNLRAWLEGGADRRPAELGQKTPARA